MAGVEEAAEVLEPGSRFAHLLQPVRDLSRVWKIEIADELEKYLAEVSQLVAAGSDAQGERRLNFAEAALLIQGSTAIYSRKVEQLYQLIYQTLDALVGAPAGGTAVASGADAGAGASGGAGGGAQRRAGAGRAQQGFLAQTDELLTIDHLLKEGRTLIGDAGQARPPMLQRRLPLFLQPRDHADRRADTSRISSCVVHPSGVYLLQASDARLLDDDPTAAEALLTTTRRPGDPQSPLVPAPPREMRELDERLQELLHGPPTEIAGAELPDELPEIAGAELPDAGGEEPGRCDDAPATPAVVPLASGAFPAPAGDPWALLDEHATCGRRLPCEVGPTSRRIDPTILRRASLPTEADCGWDVDKLFGPRGAAAFGAALPGLAAGNPVQALFLTAAACLKPSGRFEAEKASFSPAFLEFEDLLAAAAAARLSEKGRDAAQLRGRRAAAARAEEPLHEDRDGADAAAAAPDAAEGCGQDGGFAFEADGEPTAAAEESELMAEAQDEAKRRQVAALEDQISEAQARYELTIRDKLQRLQGDIVDADRERFPQLYANVQRWQDQVAPLLKQYEVRPEFDIKRYGAAVLSELAAAGAEAPPAAGAAGDDDVERAAVPFEVLARGRPPWEVCRRFLTCLALTNQGSADIVCSHEHERLNGFRVRLGAGGRDALAAALPAAEAGRRQAAAASPECRRKRVLALPSPSRGRSPAVGRQPKRLRRASVTRIRPLGR